MEETITHINQNQRFRVVIERAASTKGIDGFKVEANGDLIVDVLADVDRLYTEIKEKTMPTTYLVPEKT